ncbi:MAG TPA: LptE family protein [Thermoanaerobaculia bacterium]|nr:LptE family protein [Thermoanaerobaculia bacterium]
MKARSARSSPAPAARPIPAAASRICRRPYRRVARRLTARLALLAAAVGLAGCGYALIGRGSTLPPDIRKVYLKPIENRTPRQRVDQEVTRAIADELVKRQRFQITSTREGADAELSGAVVGFGATPVTFDTSGRATAYEISLTASILFKRLSDDKILWKNPAYNFRESYPIDASSGYFDRENIALQTAAQRFAQTMVSDLLEGF